MITDKGGLYSDLTYRVIGAVYEVHKNLGSVHKEIVYHKALAQEFKERGISFTDEKAIDIKYKGTKVGVYKPDFIIDQKVILEIKVASAPTKAMQDQVYYYIKGTQYKLALLINFGSSKVGIKRLIYG